MAAVTQSSTASAAQRVGCYIHSVLILFKDLKAVWKCWADGCLRDFGRAGLSVRGGLRSKPHLCSRCSESYPPWLWARLHRTHMGQHNEPHSSGHVSPHSAGVLFFDCSSFTSVSNVCWCLFISATLYREFRVKHLLFQNAVGVQLLPKTLTQLKNKVPPPLWWNTALKHFVLFQIKATVKHCIELETFQRK